MKKFILTNESAQVTLQTTTLLSLAAATARDRFAQALQVHGQAQAASRVALPEPVAGRMHGVAGSINGRAHQQVAAGPSPREQLQALSGQLLNDAMTEMQNALVLASQLQQILAGMEGGGHGDAGGNGGPKLASE